MIIDTAGTNTRRLTSFASYLTLDAFWVVQKCSLLASLTLWSVGALNAVTGTKFTCKILHVRISYGSASWTVCWRSMTKGTFDTARKAKIGRI